MAVKWKLRRKRILKTLLVVTILGTLFIWTTNRTVLASADGHVFTETDNMEVRPVAVVLGTSPKTREGTRNLFFERRMAAAAKLYKAGRVKKILVSGDNGSPYYDEPTAMKESLVSKGVPVENICLDYAGFRTLDSIIRAHKVFGVHKCVIVTDDFHLPRALYIAKEEGLDAIGFQTEPLPRSVSPWTYFRETAARSLVWIDVKVLNRQPKFLGTPEPI